MLNLAMFMSVDITMTLVSGSNTIGTCMAIIIYVAALRLPLIGKKGVFSK